MPPSCVSFLSLGSDRLVLSHATVHATVQSRTDGVVPTLTAETRKEGSLLTAQHIKNAAFQHWQSVHGSYANTTVIDSSNKEEKDKGKNWLFQCSVETATGVVDKVTKKLNVMQRNILMVKH